MDRLLEKIEQKVLLPGALASIAIMTCLTTFDAGGRYLLNHPIDGAYEITERYLMVCCFYFSISYAYRKGANIRLTMLTSRLPGRITLTINYVVQVIAILYCSYLLVGALQLTLQRLGERIFLANYNLPLASVYILIPMGLILLILRMILDWTFALSSYIGQRIYNIAVQFFKVVS
jgi:TRAP-type C4-dicarboxylate transport system permease small subunit